MVIAAATWTFLTLAHAPYLSVDDHPVPEEAFAIADVDRSIVLYDQVTCDVAPVWMAFDASSTDSLFLQVGVPVVERLADHRPLVYVLAEGLPEAVDVPFEVPEGLGAIVFDANEVVEPALFYEPFTGTQSWIWVEETLAIPGSGTGYIVALEGTERSGKLWVATGTIEDFSQGVGATFEDVWDFHEINGYGPADPSVEEPSCVPESGDDGGGDSGDDGGDDGGDGDGGLDGGESGEGGEASADAEGGCACSARPEGGTGLRSIVAFGLLGLLRIRRRSARAAVV
jgi:hypothetical protein